MAQDLGMKNALRSSWNNKLIWLKHRRKEPPFTAKIFIHIHAGWPKHRQISTASPVWKESFFSCTIYASFCSRAIDSRMITLEDPSSETRKCLNPKIIVALHFTAKIMQTVTGSLFPRKLRHEMQSRACQGFSLALAHDLSVSNDVASCFQRNARLDRNHTEFSAWELRGTMNANFR